MTPLETQTLTPISAGAPPPPPVTSTSIERLEVQIPPNAVIRGSVGRRIPESGRCRPDQYQFTERANFGFGGARLDDAEVWEGNRDAY
jgi:hypothetical protein